MKSGGKQQRRVSVAAPPGESRASWFITIGWTQAGLMALLAELGALVGLWVSQIWPDTAAFEALWRVLMFASFVLGLILVAMTIVVLRIRPSPPPRPLV